MAKPMTLLELADDLQAIIDGERPRLNKTEMREYVSNLRHLAQPAERAPDGIAALIKAHAELLESNPYCYFELAYTRQTEWMAWLCSNPAEDDPDRKILARGQGNTPNEACMQALGMLTAAPSPGASHG